MRIDVNTPQVLAEKGDFIVATSGGIKYIHLIVKESKTGNYTGVNLTANALHKQDEDMIFNTPQGVYERFAKDINSHNVQLVKAEQASLVLYP